MIYRGFQIEYDKTQAFPWHMKDSAFRMVTKEQCVQAINEYWERAVVGKKEKLERLRLYLSSKNAIIKDWYDAEKTMLECLIDILEENIFLIESQDKE
jgi:hypothetical protein